MRTTDQLRPATVSGGDLGPSGLHLGGGLRLGDLAVDLASAFAAGRPTLDGSLTCIRASANGVSVAHRCQGAERVGP